MNAEQNPEEEQETRVRLGRKAPFKNLPDGVLDDETISPESKVTYWYLKRIANFDDDAAVVSMGKIAEKLGRARSNRRAARGWVNELVTAGWVETHARKSRHGGDLAPEFVVHEVRDDPPAGERWRPGGGGPRVKRGCSPDPREEGDSQQSPGGGQQSPSGGSEADPHSPRGFSFQEGSLPNDVEANASTYALDVETEPDQGQQPGLFEAGVQPLSADDSKPRRRSKPKVPPGDLALRAAMFREWYQLYPRKKGRGAAEKAWLVAMRDRDNDPRELINAVARFAASQRDQDLKFVVYPARWLNEKRWLDEPEYARNGQGPGGDRPVAGGYQKHFEHIPDECYEAAIS